MRGPQRRIDRLGNTRRRPGHLRVIGSPRPSLPSERPVVPQTARRKGYFNVVSSRTQSAVRGTSEE